MAIPKPGIPKPAGVLRARANHPLSTPPEDTYHRA
uniref:Uncharacterized protein n=1 Tax=Myoviridae sp. ctzA421 TaxID=2826719 RepID=A0A8S5LUI1_9CAUD|nr:MAG TPA: hypothetical protein [Myoviridae sp. ctzA421]